MTGGERRFEAWSTEQAFSASASPYLIMDRQLRIAAVNAAYERATLQPAEALVGRYVFDAFPDNPDAPHAHSVENLTRSLETVLRRGIQDRMSIQRYDVPSPTRDGQFVFKVWSPVNSPLRDSDGIVTGILHHVEDVTAAVGRAAAEQALPSPAVTVEKLLAALVHQRQLSADLRDQNANLQIALESNRRIGMALGIVMFSHKVTAPAAFDLLRQVSQCSHRKIRDIAEDVIERGCLDL